MFNIYNNGANIGDHLIFSGMPENFYKNTGRKLCLKQGYSPWFFDFNPYLLNHNDGYESKNFFEGFKYNGEIFPSINHRKCKRFNLEKCFLRHPRLYRYEELGLKNRVVIHTTSKEKKRSLSMEMVEKIKNNYKDVDIIQVGGEGDLDAKVIDKRGLGMWETAEIIASSLFFIGCNSSMMWIANCYPKVTKKIVITEYSEEILENFIGTLDKKHDIFNHDWYDPSITHYNNYGRDVGLTFNISKI